jgi:hypothetical protein
MELASAAGACGPLCGGGKAWLVAAIPVGKETDPPFAYHNEPAITRQPRR